MKLFIENEDGSITELKEVRRIGEGDIVIKVNQICHEKVIKEMEKNLADKFRRRVILLDARYGEILTLPPKKSPMMES